IDALRGWEPKVARSLIARGADVVTNYPFARAFQAHIRTALGTYLDCRHARPDFADRLQEQADMALRQACTDGNLKWVSLLLWAGANPRSKGLAVDDLDEPALLAELTAHPETQRSA